MGIFDYLFNTTKDPTGYDYFSTSNELPEEAFSQSSDITLGPLYWVTVSTTTKTIVSDNLVYLACGVGVGILLLLSLVLALLVKFRCCKCRVSNVESSNNVPARNPSDVVVTMSQITQVANPSGENSSTHNKAE